MDLIGPEAEGCLMMIMTGHCWVMPLQMVPETLAGTGTPLTIRTSVELDYLMIWWRLVRWWMDMDLQMLVSAFGWRW